MDYKIKAEDYDTQFGDWISRNSRLNKEEKYLKWYLIGILIAFLAAGYLEMYFLKLGI